MFVVIDAPRTPAHPIGSASCRVVISRSHALRGNADLPLTDTCTHLYRSNAPRWNAREDAPASSLIDSFIQANIKKQVGYSQISHLNHEDAGASTGAFQRGTLER
jgi:hypothetical protein